MAQQMKSLILNATRYLVLQQENLHQHNPCMASGIIFVNIPYSTIYYLLYQKFLAVCAYP